MKSTFTNTQKDKDFMAAVMSVMKPQPKETPTQINEKLEDHEADEVEYGWDHRRPPEAEEQITRVFGDKGRIEIPFHRGEVSPHPDVESHLNQNGYKITDYLNGKAIDKHNRETNIGKALVKTKAPDHIKNTFENDPERQQKSKDNMKIVISHRPTDVAGMTSCGHSWEDSSCMNFKTGSNRGYLKYDVSRGTHVAYLTDKDDHDLNRPIGRIAIKPFIAVHDEHENHTIFRPEDTIYGETPHGFHSTVSNWFHEHYPAKEGVRYSKDINVYNDEGNTNYSELSHQEIEEKMRHGHAFETKMPKKNVNHIFKTLMEKTISKDDPNIMDRYAENSRNHRNVEFDRNQINDLYKSSVEHNNLSMTNHISNKYGGQLNKENLSHALDLYGEHRTLPSAIVGHKYLPKEAIDKIPTSQIGELHKSNITDAHVQRAIDSYKNNESGSRFLLNDLDDRITPEHLKGLVSHEITNNNPLIISSWLTHKNTNEEVINHAFNQIKDAYSPSEFMTHFNRHNPNPTPEHVAMTDSVSGLNDIMRNAKDNTTHNLAFYKAFGKKMESISLKKRTQSIMLRDNSDKFIGEPELEHMHQHPYIYNGSLGYMSDKVHSDLLDHHMKHINKLADEHENEEDEDKKAELEGKIDEHLENHASLIDDRMSDYIKDFREGNPVNIKNLETLRSHIDAALEHPHHYHTHDEVDADHNDLLKEIEGRW